MLYICCNQKAAHGLPCEVKELLLHVLNTKIHFHQQFCIHHSNFIQKPQDFPDRNGVS